MLGLVNLVDLVLLSFVAVTAFHAHWDLQVIVYPPDLAHVELC
ncbi:hypothetical protein AB0K00_21710 [Dactylosporangium sp. NPDC049525]